jgi:hypothetical protein
MQMSDDSAARPERAGRVPVAVTVHDWAAEARASTAADRSP